MTIKLRLFTRIVTAFALILAAICALHPNATAQNVTSASVSGTVADVNGAYISGATLSATNIETNQQFTTASDHEGHFKFPYLPVGNYKLVVAESGFTTVWRNVTLAVGQALYLVFKLEVNSVSANLTVTGISQIETTRTQVTETIRPAEINNLPLNGRNYLDLALLVPAVSPTNTGSNQRFAETSAVPGQGISVAGQRNLYNSFILDGISANDDAADLTGTYFSQEVIREFQVITSGGVAEFGRASAGVVNIVSKSGTNSWRGDLYGFGRNQRFDARNPLALRKDSLTQAQYGGTISGPLRQNQSFLFTNFEQTRRNYSAVLTIAPAAVAAINQRLENAAYRGPLVETGVAPASFDTTNFFARLDHQLTSHNQLAGRYSLYHITAINSRTVGGLNAVSRGSGLDDTDQTIAVNDVATIGNVINEARFQFTHSRLNAPVNDAVGPSVSISGVANFGTATVSPLARDINQFEAVENVALQHGLHSPKAGIEFLYNRANIVFPGAIQGVYNFSSLNNFLAGNYVTFQQAFGAPSQAQSNPNVGLFVQDEWRVRRSLTLNLGLRYDLQFLPAPIQTDTNNLAPRLGFAYAPGDRRTVIRGSAGIYFDRIPLRATSNALQRDGSKYIVVQLAPPQTGAPSFPSVLANQPAALATKPNITRIDPNIETSYSEQLSFEVERELPGEASLSVGYLHLRGLHLIVQRNVNVPRFPASAGVPNLGRPDPNWGNISRYEGSGDSWYDGMIVSFHQRAGAWASLRASYTLSKSIDDAGNFFFSTPQDNFNIRDDRGLSDNDQRHRLVISGTFETPGKKSSVPRALRDFALSYIFTYASRLPFNVLLGSDRNFDTNNNDRPAGVGRNTGAGFDYASFDMRLSRSFRITERCRVELTADGFNLFNRANYAVPNNTFGPGIIPLPTFRQPTQASDPRQFQFGLRVSF
ncbi:MAG TPA: carboxypeptidase regulatory-like domain-containing protein [Pyrinomonadaceae bacterium]|nr:carboxypeptidase regulatory-like domain-containing protein [Pyrinomonadaceae bacterium]